MLYKKIHRRYLREFRLGRRTSDGIVIRKPYIKDDCILMDVDDISSYFSKSTITLISVEEGSILYVGKFIGWDIDVIQENA